MQVRKMKKEDIPQLEHICLETADPKLISTEKEKEIILLLYNRYYTRAQADNCFVLADENDCAAGYIICAESCSEYIKGFCKNELKALVKISPQAFFSGCACILGNVPYAKQYPAHMHIDILPQYQAQGYGGKLLCALRENLQRKGISGLMLIVDSNKSNAVKFYKKNNFKEIKKFDDTIVMGVKL